MGDYCGPEDRPCHGRPYTGGQCPTCGCIYPPPIDWRSLCRVVSQSDPLTGGSTHD